MLENFHLQVFRALAKEKSFSEAAKILYLTQPAVSHQIRVLEEYLETKLFERKRGEVSLTEQGIILLKYAEQIINLYEQAEKEIADLTKTFRGRLRIGASTTIGQYLIPKIVGEFKERFTNIEIFLINANTKDIAIKLLADSIDLGLVEGPVQEKDILVERFIEDELVVITSPKHPFARRTSIDKFELLKEPLIIREEGSGTRNIIEERLNEAKVALNSLKIKMEMGSSESIKAAVEAGLGVAIISKWAILKEKKLHTLRSCSLTDVNLIRYFSIITNQKRFKTKPMEEFLKFLKGFDITSIS
ncbi:MAG: selenium metabolism-associated LysR family transcriptional regulator [bacterium]|nr:selenium metabolism-associated LysR family transcriptional regulator [bacterium]